MIFGAIGVLLILIMAICNSNNINEKTRKMLEDYHKENPYEPRY